MFTLESESRFTAGQWRAEDERHACAHCAHCRGGYGAAGFNCAELEELLGDNCIPVQRVLLTDALGICDAYECDYELFRVNTGEYPHGYDGGDGHERAA